MKSQPAAKSNPDDDSDRTRTGETPPTPNAVHAAGPQRVDPTAATDAAGEPGASETSQESGAERASLYVPRILQQHLVDAPESRWWTADGTAVLVDISGFTKLSERLARKGREGAEQIAEAIGRSFESILLVAYENGGSLLKFGGDAMLLWFEGDGHGVRACRTTILMRRALGTAGSVELPGAQITLRMSQGVHAGRFHFFAVGTLHVELLPVGPAWSRLVAMQKAARGGEILVSPDTAALLPARCVGESRGPGMLLRREPAGARKMPLVARPKMNAEALAHCLSAPVRAHVLRGGAPEHRPVTIAFIRFERTDAMLDEQGATAASEALHALVKAIQEAAAEQQVTFLGSDVDADGGKLILTAGAPRVIGDDEERMLLTLRSVLARNVPLPIRIGVHRGAVFAGDIGPFYRRTYTVMGDAVNLAARLMSEAQPGRIYATSDVLDRSDTLFETIELPPFLVKGKAQPVRAWAVGAARGSRTRGLSLRSLPMIGREAESQLIGEALARARSGSGRLIEITGEPGLGKTRLLEALREGATGFRQFHGVCEAYTATKPYAVCSELLREILGFGRSDADEVIVERLRAEVAARAPELAPWLPLIGIAFDVEIAQTPEVALLAEKNRRAKLNEVVTRFFEVLLPEASLVEIENAHHMDLASAELFAYLARDLGTRPWVLAVARRPANAGFAAPAMPAVASVELAPLDARDALRMTQALAEEHPLPLHVLQTVAERSGGNPQFLRDLVRAAIESGGAGGLPDSAEAAAMARIDALDPQERALVRRVAVLGLTFHPRMLSWLYEDAEESPPGPAAWTPLRELFDEEPDGYLRFRRPLLRDAAYEGLPYRLRRRLHSAVASHLEQESANPEDAASILSLHHFEAGQYPSAWRYAAAAGKRAQSVYAYIEAAGLYSRAIEAGRRLDGLGASELGAMHEAQADCWYRAGEYEKASDGYSAAYRLAAGSAVTAGRLLLMRSWIEEKVGKYSRALRWAARARKAVSGSIEPGAARQAARTASWYAVVLQTKGRTNDALRWAEQARAEAEAADDPEALGEAHNVLGWALGALGREGAHAHFERSLQAYERAGNLLRQAGILANMGLVCQWEGRWDEALSYYERGREGSIKLGNTIPAGLARVNIAEILIDRGEWAEAEQVLFETMPLWRASHYRLFLGACFLLLGRASLRRGRLDEALQRLEEARANFRSVEAKEEIPAVDACIAECRLSMGDTGGALELANAMLRRTSTSNAVARLEPLLRRVRAHALLAHGDPHGARRELDSSLSIARSRRDPFEIVRTLCSLAHLLGLEGVEPPAELRAESEALLAKLSIRALPPVPAPLHRSIH